MSLCYQRWIIISICVAVKDRIRTKGRIHIICNRLLLSMVWISISTFGSDSLYFHHYQHLLLIQLLDKILMIKLINLLPHQVLTTQAKIMHIVEEIQSHHFRARNEKTTLLTLRVEISYQLKGYPWKCQSLPIFVKF